MCRFGLFYELDNLVANVSSPIRLTSSGIRRNLHTKTHRKSILFKSFHYLFIQWEEPTIWFIIDLLPQKQDLSIENQTTDLKRQTLQQKYVICVLWYLLLTANFTSKHLIPYTYFKPFMYTVDEFYIGNVYSASTLTF